MLNREWVASRAGGSTGKDRPGGDRAMVNAACSFGFLLADTRRGRSWCIASRAGLNFQAPPGWRPRRGTRQAEASALVAAQETLMGRESTTAKAAA